VTPSAQAYLLVDEVSAEGHRMRRNQLLELERSALPVFVSAWTLIHQLDEKSPLYGLSLENVADRLVGIIVSLSGVDEAMLQSVHARQLYGPEDFRFGVRFADMMDTSNPATLIIDHSQMDELVIDQEPRS
jgi:inward rectifier potassium channel